MKVSENQIQQIYTFTQRHYVEWYDVQTELVDHLANGIENQWHVNPNVSFEDALTNEFKKFGIFGFQDLVEQKTNSLNKQYRKQVWVYLKAFFRLPKIILTLFFIWALYSLLHFLDDKGKDLVQITVFFTMLSVHIFYGIRFKIRAHKRKKKTGKKWLFESSITQLGGLMYVLNYGIWHGYLFSSGREWTTTLELIVSIALVLYILIFYISMVIVARKFKKKMLREHPEYHLV